MNANLQQALDKLKEYCRKVLVDYPPITPEEKEIIKDSAQKYLDNIDLTKPITDNALIEKLDKLSPLGIAEDDLIKVLILATKKEIDHEDEKEKEKTV